MTFPKGATDDELFYDIPKLDTRYFDNYNSFSTSPSVGHFGTNYVYAAMRQLISSISAITDTLPDVCTVAALVCYCINGISVCNRPVDVKKLRKFFIFNPDDIFMKTLEAATQPGGFNQRFSMWHSKKRFLYSRYHQHKDYSIDIFFSSVPDHDVTTAVELTFGTKILLTNIYAIGSNSGLNIYKVLQDRFCKHGILINIWYDNAQEEFMGSLRKIICAYGVGIKKS